MRALFAMLCGLAFAATVGATEDSKYTFVDLQPKGNHALKDDMGPQFPGNNLESLPKGEQKLEGTPFKIGEKMIRLKGADEADELPDSVEDIKVGAVFKTLYILQATEYSINDDADDKEIGAYVVHYADKTEERIPIVYGQHLQDWWGYPGLAEVTDAKVAWTGTNKGADSFAEENNVDGIKIRLFSSSWTNPHPEKEVATIDFTSKKTQCKPFVVALTTEKE
ncbi:MAG TPA: hypothetical protein VGZ22_14985 [Isosphaeraceae bacterium]|jgi:hypothetical protein|nr:hypothetical protein [Isosphaeraceae bacterium]